MSQMNPFINTIEEMFEKEFSHEGRKTLERRLERFTDDVFRQAIKDIEADQLTWRPKWPEVVNYCETADNKMRTRKSTEQNKSEHVNASNMQSKMGIELVERLLSGKYTRQQILDNIRTAEEKKPDTGWAKCGMTLEKYYSDSGMDLNKPPECHVSFEI